MKKLLLLLAALPSLCFASGKLSLSPGYYFSAGEVAPTAGLSVYESLGVAGLNFNGNAFGGYAPRALAPRVDWFAVRADVEKPVGDFVLSVGGTVRYMYQGPQTDNENNFHVGVSYVIWK